MNTTIEHTNDQTPETQHLKPDQGLKSLPIHESSNPSAALLHSLETLLARYVVLPKFAAETLALWVLHTYAFQLRDVSTYLGIESPEKRCGKTTLLGVLSKLVHRPVAASNISSPAFFRVIEEMNPTLLIDEADTFLQGNDELRGILNAGYSRETAYVMRVSSEVPDAPNLPLSSSGGGRAAASNFPLSPSDGERVGVRGPSHSPSSFPVLSRLARFSCWCPKAIARIGRLPETLADRCIVIRMERKKIGEDCARLRDLDGAALRAQCETFVTQHADAITKARPQIPNSLNDRAADIWEPLLALADIAGGDWPVKARAAAEGLNARVNDSNPTASLLLDIMFLFLPGDRERLFTREILQSLEWRRDRPWSELRRGKELTDMWLSQKLRPYGVKPRTMRIGDQLGKGYVMADLIEVFQRYVSRSEYEAFKAELKERADAQRELQDQTQGPHDDVAHGTQAL